LNTAIEPVQNRAQRRATAATEHREPTDANALPGGCDPAFDTPQAATYTGLAAAYLEKLRSVGGGPRFLRYGRRAVRYRKRDLDDWMTAHERASTSEAA
jgi:predicted DNA-binding transcriptional regulator AlpA